MDYFALPITLVDGRAAKVDSTVLDRLSAQEHQLVERAVLELSTSIQKGTGFVVGGSKL